MGWSLEIFKMALYITFPVGMFHYFNQPEFFDSWVKESKEKMYPSEEPDSVKELRIELKKFKEQQEKELQIELEKQGL